MRLLGRDPFSLFRNTKPTTAVPALGNSLFVSGADSVPRGARGGARDCRPEVGPAETGGATRHRNHVASAALKLGTRATTAPGAAAQVPKLGLDLGANRAGRGWD